MDSVLITESDFVRNALEDMLTTAIGAHGYHLCHVDVGTALMVVELAKRAPDNLDWFPRGKWATIQAIQNNIDAALKDALEALEKAK